jgi:hypothetical protein
MKDREQLIKKKMLYFRIHPEVNRFGHFLGEKVGQLLIKKIIQQVMSCSLFTSTPRLKVTVRFVDNDTSITVE